MEQRIGLYGGSFDPIHHGHLLLAREAMESLALDKILFLPARVSPYKIDTPPTDSVIRAEMIAAAICGEKGFEMDDRETRRQGPSYTIDTIREFRAERPDAKLYYLIGEDSLADLSGWRESEELCRLTEFVILPRANASAGEESLSRPVSSHTLTTFISISSTEIRTRVEKGLSIRYFTPCSVMEIIRKYQLYKK